MNVWSGFSSEDIEKVNSNSINFTPKDNSIREDDEAPFLKKSHIDHKQFNCKDARLQKVPNCSANNDNNKRTYPVPEGGSFLEQSKLIIKEKKCSQEKNDCNSSPDLSSSLTSPSSTVNNGDNSSNSNSQESQGKAVTILVGEDKSYEVLSTDESSPSTDFPEIVGMGVRGLQKAFLVERDKSLEQGRMLEQGKMLEQFQERQKLMEEQNKKRKELLTKAIADRKRRTVTEAKKLTQIQDELSRLDALLSTDVSILRDQIEVASLDFNDAQKRYDRAESEFIESKMALFAKLERKELLTEHLCRIIEANEQRKAQKLSELMAKLESADQNPVEDRVNDSHINRYHENDYSSSASLTDVVSPPSSDLVCSCPSTVKPSSAAIRRLPVSALNSVNLTTAQSLDHRNDAQMPCRLEEEIDSKETQVETNSV